MSMTRTRKRRLRRPIVVALIGVLSVVLFQSQIASASDGRPATPQGELEAQFQHSLDRPSDLAGWNNYLSFVEENCRWGIMDGSFKIANSAEAHQRWRSDPQDMAGMLYASLLDRAPDPGGLTTYTEAIRTRGLEWATASMLASPEYETRLQTICAGQPTGAADMMTWEEAASFAEKLTEYAGNLTWGCAVGKSVSQLKRLTKTKNGITQFVGRAGQIVNKINSTFKLDRTCGLILAYLKAVIRIGDLITAGEGYNPVFVRYAAWERDWTLGYITDVEILVGPDPTHWDPYSGSTAF